MSSQQSGKSPAVAWALWFFLGGVGAHRFYFGNTKSGFGMAGLWLGSLLTSPFGIGFVGFLGLTAWWVYDAFQVNKWLKGEGQQSQSEFSSPEFAQAPGSPAPTSIAPEPTTQSEAA
jgi:TM2 domain-containing membrane protein YozV